MSQKRTRAEESAHAAKIKRLAKKLEKEGYKVKADLPGSGYTRPKPIGKGKRIPDIEATKRGVRKIIEVETPSSLRKDREQLKTFTRHAAQKKRTSFDIVVTKPRTSRKKKK